MAKPSPTREYEALLNAVAQFPEGTGIEQIEATLPSRPSRRSLQRWLTDLVDQGRLRKEGQGRATRYLLGKIVTASVLVSAQGVRFKLSAPVKTGKE